MLQVFLGGLVLVSSALHFALKRKVRKTEPRGDFISWRYILLNKVQHNLPWQKLPSQPSRTTAQAWSWPNVSASCVSQADNGTGQGESHGSFMFWVSLDHSWDQAHSLILSQNGTEETSSFMLQVTPLVTRLPLSLDHSQHRLGWWASICVCMSVCVFVCTCVLMWAVPHTQWHNNQVASVTSRGQERGLFRITLCTWLVP